MVIPPRPNASPPFIRQSLLHLLQPCLQSVKSESKKSSFSLIFKEEDNYSLSLNIIQGAKIWDTLRSTVRLRMLLVIPIHHHTREMYRIGWRSRTTGSVNRRIRLDPKVWVVSWIPRFLLERASDLPLLTGDARSL